MVQVEDKLETFLKIGNLKLKMSKTMVLILSMIIIRNLQLCRAWKTKVGNKSLYLVFPNNKPQIHLMIEKFETGLWMLLMKKLNLNSIPMWRSMVLVHLQKIDKEVLNKVLRKVSRKSAEKPLKNSCGRSPCKTCKSKLH